MKARLPEPELILTSPYPRAVATAGVVASHVGFKGDCVPCVALGPEGNKEDLWGEIRALNPESALLVGHGPSLLTAASWMLREASTAVSFAPSTLVCIDFPTIDPQPRGTLLWKLP